MTKTLTGRYGALDQARNAFDGLINAGFDREKVYLDRDNRLVKVMTPDATAREARGILEEYGPAEVTERPVVG